MVLFGESHLAPGHLPRVLREQLPEERVLTVLQNVDALYWRAAGEPARTGRSGARESRTWSAYSIPRRWKSTRITAFT